MSKKLSISVLFCFFVISLFSQEYEYKTKVDTLKVYSNRIYVNLKTTYNDSIIISDEQAFLYPISIMVPKFSFFPYLFKEKVEMDSIVLHGTSKNWKLDGKFRIGEYDNGTKISMKYFDSDGEEISKSEYYEDILVWRGRGDEEKGTGRILTK